MKWLFVSRPAFYAYVAEESKVADEEGISFEDSLKKGSILRLAVVLDVMKSQVTFKICKSASDGCLEDSGRISQRLKYVNIQRGVKKIALVSNGFAPRLKFHCRISESTLPLCWTPGSTIPRLCPY